MLHDKPDGLIVVHDHLLRAVPGRGVAAEHILGHAACRGRALHLARRDGFLHQRADQVALPVLVLYQGARAPRTAEIHIILMALLLHHAGQAEVNMILRPDLHDFCPPVGHDEAPQILRRESRRQGFILRFVPVFVMVVDALHQLLHLLRQRVEADEGFHQLSAADFRGLLHSCFSLAAKLSNSFQFSKDWKEFRYCPLYRPPFRPLFCPSFRPSFRLSFCLSVRPSFRLWFRSSFRPPFRFTLRPLFCLSFRPFGKLLW